MQDRNAIFQKRQIARGVLSGKRRGVGSLAFGSELAAKSRAGELDLWVD